MFSFDGECVYDASVIKECFRIEQIQNSSNFFLQCKQETKYDISDVTLWKNIKCVMLILFFVHDSIDTH